MRPRNKKEKEKKEKEKKEIKTFSTMVSDRKAHVQMSHIQNV